VSGERVELPADFQEQLARLQQLQQTLQMIVAQKQQIELEISDVDRASVVQDLTERKELLNVRMSVLSKQEERTREKLKEIQQQIQDRLRQFQPPPPRS
jgi:prefoldin beta subunit